jgi:hypothetical protein
MFIDTEEVNDFLCLNVAIHKNGEAQHCLFLFEIDY